MYILRLPQEDLQVCPMRGSYRWGHVMLMSSSLGGCYNGHALSHLPTTLSTFVEH
jgi:hypothetical protein